MTSSPGSATAFSASGIAVKPPVVRWMSAGSKGIPSSRCREAAAAACASGSFVL